MQVIGIGHGVDAAAAHDVSLFSDAAPDTFVEIGTPEEGVSTVDGRLKLYGSIGY